MRELAMFAGVGGGILGSMLLGHTIVGANEYEEYPCKVLRQRQEDGALPEFPIWHMDIREFNERVAPTYTGMVDIVSGGFPCQDISCAGSGAGIEGERSGLWKELSKTIRIIRPQYAFLENSPMLTVRGLGVVLRDLAEMGCDGRWGCVSAANAGADHKRERIWIMAYPNSKRLQGIVCNELGVIQESFKPPKGRQFSGGDAKNEKWSAWDVEPSVGRVANGVPYRVDRLKGIGNAQCPQSMALAFRILMEELWNHKN